MRKEEIIVCDKCGKKFSCENYGDVWAGGKDREKAFCPYCNEFSHSMMTSGTLVTRKIEE